MPIPNNSEEEELLRQYNNLREPIFRDILPSLPFPLIRPDNLPPQPPIVDVLKADFDSPIANLIDKANNITEMISQNQKQDLDKLDVHSSEQLSKLFPEVEDGDNYVDGQNNDQKINELPIPELTEISI